MKTPEPAGDIAQRIMERADRREASADPESRARARGIRRRRKKRKRRPPSTWRADRFIEHASRALEDGETRAAPFRLAEIRRLADRALAPPPSGDLLAWSRRQTEDLRRVRELADLLLAVLYPEGYRDG